MSALETIDLTDWNRFTELWSTDVAHVFEWLEGAETCLQAVREQKFSDQLANEIKLSKARLETGSKIVDEISNVFSAIAKPTAYQDQSTSFRKNSQG